MAPVASSPVIIRRRDARGSVEAQAFLDHLVVAGRLDRLAAERAREVQRQTRERIDVILLQLGQLSETDLTTALASYFDLPVVTAAELPDLPVLPDLLSVEFLRRVRLLPIAATDHNLVIATADPFASDTHAAAGFACGRVVSVRLTSPSIIEAALTRLYPSDASAAGKSPPPAGLAATAAAPDADVQRLKDLASTAPVIRLVHDLIQAAVEARASDIHIEPMADSLRIRYRIDGVMTEVQRLGLDLLPAIASRIKILARLDVAESRVPQDGRTSIVFRGREIDIRVATAPLLGGESLVLRILDRTTVPLTFEALGFDTAHAATLKRLISEPNGIILVTGPTGSGKTTTLYAALATLNAGERKIFTVEDPIEFQLSGINQMQVKPALDLTFASGLRAILRQDPDIVMVGEMRDDETARTGVQAALTGHLVLATLHTNSAAASVTRLLDMGVEDYLLASTLTGIVAQRLVRKLCSNCSLPDPDAASELAALSRNVLARVPKLDLRKPCGCPACRGSGFLGRTTIAEIMRVDAALARLIRRGVTAGDLDAEARANGMVSILENGLDKVATGETTLAEVVKVVRN